MCGLFELPEGGDQQQQQQQQSGSVSCGPSSGTNGLLNGDTDHLGGLRDSTGGNSQGTPESGILPPQNSSSGNNPLL